MVVRWMSFSHVWIALGAFSTTVLSGMWDTTLSMTDWGGLWVAAWVGLSTGLGYTVQRAIKHTRHPNNMPNLRRHFWEKNQWPMVATWLAAWALFNWRFRDHLGWNNPGRIEVVGGLALASLVYAAAPGMNGGLRRVLWLKIPIVAAVWATATTHHPVQGVEPILWVQRALFIAGLTLPFDIRDLEVDRRHMTTLPMVKSPKDVLRLARVLLLASASLSLLVGVERMTQSATDIATAGPLLLTAQCLWALWVLRPSIALGVLQSDDEYKKEQYTGWRLDGVLVLPLGVWVGIHFVLTYLLPMLHLG